MGNSLPIMNLRGPLLFPGVGTGGETPTSRGCRPWHSTKAHRELGDAQPVSKVKEPQLVGCGVGTSTWHWPLQRVRRRMASALRGTRRHSSLGSTVKKKKKVKQFTLAFGSHSKQCFIIRGFCQGRNVRNLRHQCLLIGCPHTRGKRTKHLGKLETI